MHFQCRIITVLSIAVSSLAYCLAQTRVVSSFNKDWQYFKANNSTFFTEFQNGAAYEETRDQWTAVEVWNDVDLPHTHNAQDMQKDRNFFEGRAVYRKKFTPPSACSQGRTFLKFEGVGSVAQLYVNGKYIGEHKGGYAMFVFEVSNSLVYGAENEITVLVDNSSRKDVIPINHFLFPVYAGIYRPVHLITTNKTSFVVTDQASPGIFIRQKNVGSRNATIEIEAKIETKLPTTQDVSLELSIHGQDGKAQVVKRYPVRISPQGVTYISKRLQMENPHLWDGIHDPYLYKVTAKLLLGEKELDLISQPLGIRKIEFSAGKGVFLNGRRYPMYGVCRHQDSQDYGSALSFAQHKRDMQMIREMGATTIRLAHYQQSPEIYSLADSLGLLTWAEIPFVNRISYYENDNAKQQMVELIKQNMNHPSIYIWGVHNEVYSRTADEQVPVLSRELNDIAKTLDPDRLTVSVSGYNVVDRQENLSTDVQGINHYFGWYGGAIGDLEIWAQKVKDKFPEYKIILSEYGADGNIDIGQEEIQKPDNVISGDSFPENYQTETHIKQWAAIERSPIIGASYVWNMFEFAVPAWNRGGVNARNLKGLVTFDRKRRKDAFFWYKANWNPEPMIYLANRRDMHRTEDKTTIQIFSNLSKVQLVVNGMQYNAVHGVNDKHWVLDNVTLKAGENVIRALGKSGSEVLMDEMVWVLE